MQRLCARNACAEAKQTKCKKKSFWRKRRRTRKIERGKTMKGREKKRKNGMNFVK